MSGTSTVLVALGALVLVGVLRRLTRPSTREPRREPDVETRRASWCEDGFLDHMGGVCRHAVATRADEAAAAEAVDTVERRTLSQALANIDLQLAVMSDLLEVWPDDTRVLQRRDELLDARSAMTRAAAAPRRVVRAALLT